MAVLVKLELRVMIFQCDKVLFTEYWQYGIEQDGKSKPLYPHHHLFFFLEEAFPLNIVKLTNLFSKLFAVVSSVN